MFQHSATNYRNLVCYTWLGTNSSQQVHVSTFINLKTTYLNYRTFFFYWRSGGTAGQGSSSSGNNHSQGGNSDSDSGSPSQSEVNRPTVRVLVITILDLVYFFLPNSGIISEHIPPLWTVWFHSFRFFLHSSLSSVSLHSVLLPCATSFPSLLPSLQSSSFQKSFFTHPPYTFKSP